MEGYDWNFYYDHCYWISCQMISLHPYYIIEQWSITTSPYTIGLAFRCLHKLVMDNDDLKCWNKADKRCAVIRKRQTDIWTYQIQLVYIVFYSSIRALKIMKPLRRVRRSFTTKCYGFCNRNFNRPILGTRIEE